MEIVELVKRIREKENPKRAEELISLINEKGEGYANDLMGFYDDIHMKYDNVLYGESGRGVLIVEKNGMYGVTDKNGNKIIPCEFKEYSDVYHEWEEMGFPKEPVVMIEERLAAQQFKNGLKSKDDELVTSGGIVSKIINDVINDNPITINKKNQLLVTNGSYWRDLINRLNTYNSREKRVKELLFTNQKYFAFWSKYLNSYDWEILILNLKPDVEVDVDIKKLFKES